MCHASRIQPSRDSASAPVASAAFSSNPPMPNRRASSCSTWPSVDTAMAEQHQGVKQQVGGLADEVGLPRLARLVGGLDHLGRFLDHLGPNRRHPAFQQRDDVRLAACRRSRLRSAITCSSRFRIVVSDIYKRPLQRRNLATDCWHARTMSLKLQNRQSRESIAGGFSQATEPYSRGKSEVTARYSLDVKE